MITLVQESCGIATAHIWGKWRRSGGGGACPTPFVPISLGEGGEGEGEKGKKKKGRGKEGSPRVESWAVTVSYSFQVQPHLS